jgi:hypothetical protein
MVHVPIPGICFLNAGDRPNTDTRVVVAETPWSNPRTALPRLCFSPTRHTDWIQIADTRGIFRDIQKSFEVQCFRVGTPEEIALPEHVPFVISLEIRTRARHAHLHRV